MKNRIKQLFCLLTISFLMTACHDDLDQNPIDPDSFTEQNVFANATVAKGALAKLYASLTLTGQNGGDSGAADIADIDQGFSQFTRMLFNLNELTTDHAVVGWGDPGLPDLHGMYWSANNDFTGAMYLRLAQEVSFTNAFIKNASALSGEEVDNYIAEARFLRAFAYYNLIDFYANVQLVTQITTDLPSQSSRQDLFNFVESELLEIQDLLPDTNEYGRVDKVAAWALLSRLYLNAEVWTGTARYTDCITYSSEVINSSSYIINMNDANGNGTAYDELFLADNHTNGAQNEFIFALNFDGVQSQTYGGSTFLVHAATGGSMDPVSLGINGGWGGYRTTKALVEKFETGEIDTPSLNSSLVGTISNWGLVGDATENGWDGPDMEMYETSPNQFSLYAELADGLLKFRFNEDWGVNYGDDGADGTLEPGGANIDVTAGTYLITFDLDNLSYSFSEVLPSGDMRGMFYTDGQSLEIASIPPFNQGYAVMKFKNIDSNGDQGNDSRGEFVDVDLAIIRLAEIYLNYAEANLRGGGGDMNLAVEKINELRMRAYGDSSGAISSADLTLEFILDERSRELYWEGLRRTDLIRFNSFTTANYLWPFKGNQPNGTATSSFRKIFPIPTNTISTNPNLIQNEGY